MVQLTQQRLDTSWQQKLFTKLFGLQYRFVYKLASTNRAADVLSRKPSQDSVCAAVSVVYPQWVQEVIAGYAQDPSTLSMLAKLTIDPQAVPDFSLREGVIRHHNRIWIGNNPPLQQKILQAVHASVLRVHSGLPVTLMRLKQMFDWRGMKTDAKNFVSSCLVCQQAKPDRSRLLGLLQPLPVLADSWQTISTDFVDGLPRSGNANCILVVIDSFTKYGHFLPLLQPFTAAVVAKVFLNNIYHLHGLPNAIISDRDRVFTSTLWQELFRLADVKLQMSSSYHPQSDDQTEHLNQSMETFLRWFVNACPSKWSSWLALAEFWYNSSPHYALALPDSGSLPSACDTRQIPIYTRQRLCRV